MAEVYIQWASARGAFRWHDQEYARSITAAKLQIIRLKAFDNIAGNAYHYRIVIKDTEVTRVYETYMYDNWDEDPET